MTDRVPYRPSNSTEGDWFESQWCDRCGRRGDDQAGYCAILGTGLSGETPSEWTSNLAGNNPVCSAFVVEVPEAVWDACAARCAQFGDPPCRRVEPGCRPCHECVAASGVVLVEPLDPDAVVRPLL